MTPMSGALDWLAVGDVAEERTVDDLAILGGGAARLAAHAAALGIRTALVAKLGDDDAGRHVREALDRLKVELQWLRIVPGMRTTVWHQPDGQAPDRRVERGADLSLRLDELPPLSLTAALTVVSGYSLSVEPARSAALGALTVARARTGHSALLLEADLLWWTNARMTRRVLEPALSAADSVALRAADAHALFGPIDGREAVRLIAEMGPRLVYLTQADGSVLLRESSRVYACAGEGASRDRYAGPAAFWVALAQNVAPRKAALDSVRYAQSVRRAGAPRQLHAPLARRSTSGPGAERRREGISRL
jgi:sugar/nucleoside kinase (ribokinase family)